LSFCMSLSSLNAAIPLWVAAFLRPKDAYERVNESNE